MTTPEDEKAKALEAFKKVYNGEQIQAFYIPWANEHAELICELLAPASEERQGALNIWVSMKDFLIKEGFNVFAIVKLDTFIQSLAQAPVAFVRCDGCKKDKAKPGVCLCDDCGKRAAPVAGDVGEARKLLQEVLAGYYQRVEGGQELIEKVGKAEKILQAATGQQAPTVPKEMYDTVKKSYDACFKALEEMRSQQAREFTEAEIVDDCLEGYRGDFDTAKHNVTSAIRYLAARKVIKLRGE